MITSTMCANEFLVTYRSLPRLSGPVRILVDAHHRTRIVISPARTRLPTCADQSQTLASATNFPLSNSLLTTWSTGLEAANVSRASCIQRTPADGSRAGAPRSELRILTAHAVSATRQPSPASRKQVQNVLPSGCR